MATPNAKDQKPTTDVKPRRDKAAEAEVKLRDYHALGRKVIARVKEGKLDADTLQEMSDETGHGHDNLRKARVFATRYTDKQLDELCGLRTPQGMPLPWRHVRQLLMLPPGETREELQRKATELGWSLEELVAAIPKKVRSEQTRREGGRAFLGPKTLVDGLRQIAQHGEEWLRRFGSKAWAGDDWLEGKAGAAGSDGLEACLAEAQDALKKVRESLTELEGKLKQVETEVKDRRSSGSKAASNGLAGAKKRRRTRGQGD